MTDELHHYATCGALGDMPPMGDPEGPELLRELGSEFGLDLAGGRDAADRERLARWYEGKAEGFERWIQAKARRCPGLEARVAARGSAEEAVRA